MMEFQIQESMQRRFLILPAEKVSFEERMAAALSGDGLLRPEICFEGVQRSYRYDITGFVSLPEHIKNRWLSERQIGTMLSELHCAVREMEQHLLEGGQLCLFPELIFVLPGQDALRFCVVPGKTAEFSKEARFFLDLLLAHADETDYGALRLCAHIFRIRQKESFDSAELSGAVIRARDAMHHGKTRRRGLQRDDRVWNTESSAGSADFPAGAVAERDYKEDMSGQVKNLSEQAMPLRSSLNETELINRERWGENEYDTDDVLREAVHTEIESDDSDKTEEQTEPEAAGPVLRIIVSVLILTAAMGAVAVLRGIEAALRFLPVYAVLCVCTGAYFAVGAWLARKDGLKSE